MSETAKTCDHICTKCGHICDNVIEASVSTMLQEHEVQQPTLNLEDPEVKKQIEKAITDIEMADIGLNLMNEEFTLCNGYFERLVDMLDRMNGDHNTIDSKLNAWENFSGSYSSTEHTQEELQAKINTKDLAYVATLVDYYEKTINRLENEWTAASRKHALEMTETVRGGVQEMKNGKDESIPTEYVDLIIKILLYIINQADVYIQFISTKIHSYSTILNRLKTYYFDRDQKVAKDELFWFKCNTASLKNKDEHEKNEWNKFKKILIADYNEKFAVTGFSEEIIIEANRLFKKAKETQKENDMLGMLLGAGIMMSGWR